MSGVSANECSELKCLSRPPAAVKQIGTAILILVGDHAPHWDEHQTWKAFQKFMGNVKNMLNRLETLDPKTVTPEQREAAKKAIEGLSEEEVKNVSRSACSLYLWATKTIQAAEP